jgi:benzodiazapine receptor
VSTDQRRQLAIVVTFVITLVVNWAANALPLNGQRTADISDRFEVFVIPAGYVFSIWGLIYVLLAAFVVDQARPSRAGDPTLRRLGWLPVVANLANALWVVLFQYEQFVLTVPVMIALLLTLIRINAITFADRERLVGGQRWTVRLPFSIYLGWITIATIANIAQTLQAIGVAVDPAFAPVIAGAVLVVGLAIAVTYVWRFADIAYGAVVVWAYAGIAVKEAGTPLVAGLAIGGAVLVGALLVATLVAGRAPAAERMVGIGPSRGDGIGRLA